MKSLKKPNPYLQAKLTQFIREKALTLSDDQSTFSNRSSFTSSQKSSFEPVLSFKNLLKESLSVSNMNSSSIKDTQESRPNSVIPERETQFLSIQNESSLTKNPSHSRESTIDELSAMKAKISHQHSIINSLKAENKNLASSLTESLIYEKNFNEAQEKIKKLEEEKKEWERSKDSKKRFFSINKQLVFAKEPSRIQGMELLKRELISEKLKTKEYKISYDSEVAQTDKLRKKIKKLEEDLRVIKIERQKSELVSLQADNMEFLKKKNAELINLMLDNADNLYEKNLEIKSLLEQREKILKELNDTKENVKEILELRQYITYLLDVITKLRIDMRNFALKHALIHQDKGKTRKSKAIISEITSIAKNTKIRMSDIVLKAMNGIDGLNTLIKQQSMIVRD
ncbi:hypothetical protein SteCoe_19491 [Stentor coeruleus]|uniref:Uncharacterized protein n=1 Tax=Stentor coeruleus TaxID=5963 RepID=A0A1R2BU04_9CILI|nr:hypothetical protein SteCoe_19491 [Stentor coeruleus]